MFVYHSFYSILSVSIYNPPNFIVPPKVAAESDYKTTLIYRASDASSHPFRREIEAVMARGGTDVHWMYSKNKVKWQGPY